MNPGAPEPEQTSRSERTTMLATVAGVAAIVLVVLFANLIGNVGPGSRQGQGPSGVSSTPSATPTPQRSVLDQLPPEEVAALGIDNRPPVGAKALAKAAEKAAAVQPFTFRISSFNVLGSQHSGAGRRRPGVRRPAGSGPTGRPAWSRRTAPSVVGMQEVQADQSPRWRRATPVGSRSTRAPSSAAGASPSRDVGHRRSGSRRGRPRSPSRSWTPRPHAHRAAANIATRAARST